MIGNLSGNVGDIGFNPWSRKSPHSAEQLSLCATTTEPALYSPRATPTKTHVPRAHALQQEKPTQQEAPAHCSQRKPMPSKEDVAQPKIIIINKYILKIKQNYHMIQQFHSGYHSRITECRGWKYFYTYVNSSIIHNSRKAEATCSTDEWINKMWSMYTIQWAII